MSKPKLHIHIPSLPQKTYEYRRGDSIIVYDDNKNAILIDGGQGDLFIKTESWLKAQGIRHVCFILSHWHSDHDCGLKSALNSSWIIVDEIYAPDPAELKRLPQDDGYSEYARATKIIGLAKELGKKIVYPPANKRTGHWVGRIRVWMYREGANPSYPTDYQVNNTSMQCHFPDLAFNAGGDAISGARKKYLKKFASYEIVGAKGSHHGNSDDYETCGLLDDMGCQIYYYTDWEPKGIEVGGTNFSKYGAGRAKQYFTMLRPFEDINVTADGAGHVTWTQGKDSWTYDISYGRVKGVVESPANSTPAVSLRDMSELFGIDVSYANSTIDWDKAAGEIDFAIIQAGYGQDRTSQDDKQFARNCSECERLGIPYGIYLYSYAGNTTRAAGEADHVLRLAKGKQMSLPIYYDIEESSIAGAASGNMGVFGTKVETAGYHCGLYAGEYYYNRNLNNVNRFTKWIAKYGSNNGRQGTKPNVDNVVIWQYSSKGRVSGISGNVDVNVMYGDALLKSVTGKDYILAARKVWAGKYGKDEERVKALTAEGYDPRIVQHFVNRLAK